jgi:hypothetical protein
MAVSQAVLPNIIKSKTVGGNAYPDVYCVYKFKKIASYAYIFLESALAR